MPADDCADLIADSTIMIRGIRDRDIDHQRRKIKKGAFVPRRNGKDDDGLSISQPLQDSLPELMERMSRESPDFCQFAAGAARRIVVDSVKLEVCSKPTPRDPLHALIKNVPTSVEMAGQANRFAELLASVATLYHPPKD